MANALLAPEQQFALLSLPINNARIETPRPLSLPNGYAFSPLLPVEVPDHWREWIGSIHLEKLQHASFYLLAPEPITGGRTLEAGWEHLHTKAYRLYLGLLITVDFASHERGTLLQGLSLPNGPDVHQLVEYQQLYFVPGAPDALITPAKLRHAAKLASAIEEIYRRGGYARFGRVLRCFLNALRSSSYDDRIHQCVRCVEGFVHPGRTNIKKRFTERAQFFTGRQFKNLLDTLYDIRSVVEHLHGSFHGLQAASDRERLVELGLRAMQAEGLARFCLKAFLSNESLWEHFVDEQALESFWALPERQRRALWPTRLGMDAVTRLFDRRRHEEFLARSSR